MSHRRDTSRIDITVAIKWGDADFASPAEAPVRPHFWPPRSNGRYQASASMDAVLQSAFQVRTWNRWYALMGARLKTAPRSRCAATLLYEPSRTTTHLPYCSGAMPCYARVRDGRCGGDPSMACKGSGVQIPSAPPGTAHRQHSRAGPFVSRLSADHAM